MTGAATADGADIRYQRTLLFVVMLAVMTFGSLMTIVTVALGQIADDLGSSRATLTWVITGLILAMAVITPIGGKLGDLYGHRRIFLIGLALGATTTVLSGFAWDAASLIVFRVLFGVSGALVNPNAIALMMEAYGAERRATAMGWFQFAMTGAPTIGLVVGGPFIDVIGWRAIFFAFAGVSCLALVAGTILIRPTSRTDDSPLDYLGAATLAFGVFTGLVSITRFTTALRDGGLGALATDGLGWLLAALCALGIAAFIRVEQQAPAPMLNLGYFSERNFTMPMVSSAFMQFAYMGGFVVTPALLTDRYGWTVGAIALLMTPRPGAFSLASPLGGYLPRVIGERMPVIIGSLLMIASMAAFVGASLTTSLVGIALIVLGLVLSGVASGVSQPSVASLVVGTVDEADLGVANGMSQQVMFVGIVCGIQTMNVLIGDDAGAATFAGTYVFGMVVATAGLVTALAIRETQRREGASFGAAS